MVCCRSVSEIEMLWDIKESKKMKAYTILENHMLYNLVIFATRLIISEQLIMKVRWNKFLASM